MGQKPGILSNLEISQFEKSEQCIVRKLSKIWFITFSRRQHFKNSDYSFVFAKPTDDLIKAFHLSREVLVIFNPYQLFDTRSFDFVDKLIFEFQNRLDKLCIIIISQDTGIKDKIRQIALQDKESRIIIPYNYDEFFINSNSSSTLIVNRLKEFFYERDLFAFDSPLRNDTYFFGRSQTIQYLYGKYKSGENGCLFGLRKIGKTSALFAVKRYLEIREEPVVYIDCSEPSFHLKRWYESLHFLIDNLIKSISIRSPRSLHEVDDYQEKTASQCFEEDLITLRKAGNFPRFLFILDEIENITFGLSPSEYWSSDKDFIFFWQSIRSVYQKNPDLFSFIIAGVNPTAVETPSILGFDNPIYKIVTPMYLPLFNISEVNEMVTSIGNYMGLQFDDEVFTYLTDDYGGHPFLTRQVCSFIHRNTSDPRPYKISRFRYQKLRTKLNQYIKDYIGMIVSVLVERYKEEYEFLELLASGDQKTFLYYVSLSPSIIEHLKGYGLIEEDSGLYHFKIKTVQEYIIEMSSRKKILNTKEDKWREITAQRGLLESDLRKVIKLVLKTYYGAAQAGEEFLKIIPSDRRNSLLGLEFDKILSDNSYFDELRKIIIKHWEKFGKIFNNDKENFEFYMNFINKHRIDAHAKEIDEENLNVLLLAICWIQRNINDYLK